MRELGIRKYIFVAALQFGAGALVWGCVVAFPFVLVLLVALNDPMYIARVMLGGNHALYNISVLGQICFSGGLFLFWLVYADGMNAPSSQRGCCFYFPKVLLVCIYIGVSATMFLVHGRVEHLHQRE